MSDCVFCQIVSGAIPANFVRVDDRFVAFHDAQPRSDHHVLVIPRSHHENLDAFLEAGNDASAMLGFVHETARDLGVDGRYRLITNVGGDAGQVVMHLHWHLLAGSRIPGF